MDYSDKEMNDRVSKKRYVEYFHLDTVPASKNVVFQFTTKTLTSYQLRYTTDLCPKFVRRCKTREIAKS